MNFEKHAHSLCRLKYKTSPSPQKVSLCSLTVSSHSQRQSHDLGTEHGSIYLYIDIDGCVYIYMSPHNHLKNQVLIVQYFRYFYHHSSPSWPLQVSAFSPHTRQSLMHFLLLSMFLRFMHILMYFGSFLLLNYIPLYEHITCYPCSSVDEHLSFPSIWQL